MKHMNIRLFLACICLFACINAFAYDACIDGIYYNFSGDEATVTYGDSQSNSYSGEVVIPCFVTHEGKTYRVTTIGHHAFYLCDDLTSITIPTYVMHIEDEVSVFCTNLREIKCYAVVIPEITGSTFMEATQITLSVLPSLIYDYPRFGWRSFADIIRLDVASADELYCMTFSNGELKFDHPGIIYCDIACSDPGFYIGNNLSLSLTYKITAFLTGEWLDRSKVLHATLCWINTTPEKVGDIFVTNTPVEEVESQPVLIQSQGSTISVDGAPEGELITLYSTDGKLLDTAVASKGKTSLDGSCLSGSIAIVKIGDRSIKAKIK